MVLMPAPVDYLKKPFDPEELIVRIKHRFTQKSEETTYGDLIFNPKNGLIRKNDETFHLGDVQKEIFALLLERAGSVVPIDTMFDRMREPNHNALRVAISKMKKKLGIEISNIRGEGYMIEKL